MPPIISEQVTAKLPLIATSPEQPILFVNSYSYFNPSTKVTWDVVNNLSHSSWFTTSHMVYWVRKPIERLVYCLIKQHWRRYKPALAGFAQTYLKGLVTGSHRQPNVHYTYLNLSVPLDTSQVAHHILRERLSPALHCKLDRIQCLLCHFMHQPESDPWWQSCLCHWHTWSWVLVMQFLYPESLSKAKTQ